MRILLPVSAFVGLQLSRHTFPDSFRALTNELLLWQVGCAVGWWIGVLSMTRSWKSDFLERRAPVLSRIAPYRYGVHVSFFLLLIAIPSVVGMMTEGSSVPGLILLSFSSVCAMIWSSAWTRIEEAYYDAAARINSLPTLPSVSPIWFVVNYFLSNLILMVTYYALMDISNPRAMKLQLEFFILVQVLWFGIVTDSFYRDWKRRQSAMRLIRQAEQGEIPARASEAGPLLYRLLAMFDRFRKHISRLQHHSSEMTAASKLIADFSAEQNETITRQSASASETSGTLQSLLESSQTIAERASAVVGLADDTEKRSDQGLQHMTVSLRQLSQVREKNQQAVSDIIQLSETMREIEQVLALITSISEDTHLISLNATIEASSAGEHGLRFKIVANEVRELSDRVAQAVLKTRRLIEGIHDATQRLVASSVDTTDQTETAFASAQKTHQLLQDISSWAKRSAEAARDIYVSIQHQRVSNEQISSSFQNITQAIQALRDTSSRYREYAQTLKKFSAGMEDVLSQYHVSPDSDGFLS